ncbi:unnamed protein product, partial [Brassica oleracea]
PRWKNTNCCNHISPATTTNAAALLEKYEATTTSDPPQKKSSQPRRKSTMLQPHQSHHNEETPQLCWKSTEIHYYHQSERRAFQHLKPKKSISCTELFIWKGDSQSDCHIHRTCRKRRQRQYQTPVECRPPPPKI